MDASGGFSWVVYSDHEGDFAPVFTTEETARKRHKNVQPEPMIAEVEARVLFSMLKDKPVKVRVIASNQTRLVMDPASLGPLLEGKLTENTGKGGATEKTTLHPLAAEQVPMKLRQAIRVFCLQRQGRWRCMHSITWMRRRARWTSAICGSSSGCGIIPAISSTTFR
jgi:hypothetical protein